MTHTTTLLDKIWSAHEVVEQTAESPSVLYVDLHLVHEVSSPQAFQMLRAANLRPRAPGKTLATLDHATPTDAAQLNGTVPFAIPQAQAQVQLLQENARAAGIELFDLRDPRRGIVHVIGPELGLTQPGMTIVCGDSHTSTHGAFGALAFGIGSTEVAHVLATQCVLQNKPRSFAVTVHGDMPRGATAKDLILSIIQRIGASGGTGHFIEYRGSTLAALSMEARMTVCNMSIEAGARGGMIAPDDTTIRYLENRERVPKGAEWERRRAQWQTLRSDEGAHFDRELTVDASSLAPMITYGTNPSMAMAVDACVPEATDVIARQALQYMGLDAGQRVLGKPIDVVFLGSCTNGRLEDLQLAASLLRGRRVAPNVRMLVVPGSQQVKRAAEAAGLAQIFVDAGAEWRQAGCSMCVGMNGDTVPEGRYCVSTSNRNFEGRQGVRARTMLASPLTAAASAVAGAVADPRDSL